ncbi:hypothetical protein ASD65_01355 [Microbacterium sp. Root61]|uniref:YciI family protein n=1 Tax=Microbacterium sp. Root61 TaxID=1736570 RepID=UPI0006F20B9E|nr:YciI family protein [Microbacterium sp. Root61]KRA23217.1 hypothetical protein ASD65_01355 [Microbacterium sp. Root61]
MSQWLYKIVPTRPEMVAEATEHEIAVVSAHFQYLLALKERGVLILAGRTQEDVGTFGLTIFEAPDEASALVIMRDDPAVAGGVMAATLHPYAVAVARDGLAD